ncbi:hypothetical protein CH289_17415 [Rhodococcus sp. RS1C4]|nr:MULTISPECIES: hypothetical protein [unclassified Rhodococcus (in: high G+C Gram-positive bacteria)]OZC49313.1 hypothetical protein CH289_17415 [Rhodococcus sp. RS1C4]OZF01470.1 hypothetical protein CH300_17650 [Rhodococcus sp. 15-1154-1]OZF52544.1 hypothetical protein CH292_10445 [Rhodococcus sp. 14-2470-1a]
MLKRILASFVLVVSIAAVAAPAASADPVSYLPGPVDSTDSFVSVFDPAAYGSRSDASLVISPYGTSQPIRCAWARGQNSCSQTDLWGNHIALNRLFFVPGSATYMDRPVYVFAP